MDASTYAYDCPGELPTTPYTPQPLTFFGPPLTIVDSDEMRLLNALADAACVYYISHGGQGGDALMAASKAIYEQRQSR